MQPEPRQRYAKIDLDGIKKVLDIFPELQALRKELNKSLSKSSFLQNLLEPPFYWSKIYEHSLTEHLAITAQSLGILKLIIDFAKSENDDISTLISIFDEYNNSEETEELTRKQKQLIIITMNSLCLTLESIQVHGQSINHLVQKVKNGSDNALFQIIQIDRSAVSCPCIADRIALAELEQDQNFFDSLQKTFNGPSKKKFTRYRELRFILEVFNECGTLDNLSIEEQYQVFCIELNAYPNHGSDPARSLHQFIQRWRSDRST
jgi:hypothetical protein